MNLPIEMQAWAKDLTIDGILEYHDWPNEGLVITEVTSLGEIDDTLHYFWDKLTELVQEIMIEHWKHRQSSKCSQCQRERSSSVGS